MMHIISGCGNTSKTTAAKASNVETLNIKNEEVLHKIAFLTFEVLLADSTSDQYSFKLINKIFSEGSLKKQQNQSGANEPYFIYYKIAGDDDSEEVLGKVPNPLLMVYEYPGDNNNMQKAMIRSKKGEFVIRFQLHKSLKHIYFYKADTNTNNLKQVYHALL